MKKPATVRNQSCHCAPCHAHKKKPATDARPAGILEFRTESQCAAVANLAAHEHMATHTRKRRCATAADLLFGAERRVGAHAVVPAPGAASAVRGTSLSSSSRSSSGNSSSSRRRRSRSSNSLFALYKCSSSRRSPRCCLAPDAAPNAASPSMPPPIHVIFCPLIEPWLIFTAVLKQLRRTPRRSISHDHDQPAHFRPTHHPPGGKRAIQTTRVIVTSWVLPGRHVLGVTWPPLPSTAWPGPRRGGESGTSLP